MLQLVCHCIGTARSLRRPATKTGSRLLPIPLLVYMTGRQPSFADGPLPPPVPKDVFASHCRLGSWCQGSRASQGRQKRAAFISPRCAARLRGLNVAFQLPTSEAWKPAGRDSPVTPNPVASFKSGMGLPFRNSDGASEGARRTDRLATAWGRASTWWENLPIVSGECETPRPPGRPQETQNATKPFGTESPPRDTA